MEIKLEFDEHALRRSLNQVVGEGLNEIGNDLQQALDEVKATHGGKPISEVAPALRSALTAHHTDLLAEHFEAFTEAISEGRRVVVNVEKPNLDA